MNSVQCTHWNKIDCQGETQMGHVGNDELKEQVFDDLCEELGHEPDEQTLKQAIQERMENIG